MNVLFLLGYFQKLAKRLDISKIWTWYNESKIQPGLLFENRANFIEFFYTILNKMHVAHESWTKKKMMKKQH